MADSAMWIDYSQTVKGHIAMGFTLEIKDPEMVSAPAVSVYGYDYDAYITDENGSTKIVGSALPWLAFILTIAENPALIKAIRNQYNDLIAAEQEAQDG
jgi:hypothetical protein